MYGDEQTTEVIDRFNLIKPLMKGDKACVKDILVLELKHWVERLNDLATVSERQGVFVAFPLETSFEDLWVWDVGFVLECPGILFVGNVSEGLDV